MSDSYTHALYVCEIKPFCLPFCSPFVSFVLVIEVGMLTLQGVL